MTSGERESLFAVAWTRTLTGEKGYVGAISEDHFQPVATLDEAEHLSRSEANEVCTRLSGHVAIHAYLVPLDA